LHPTLRQRHSATPRRRHYASFFARPDFFIDDNIFIIFDIDRCRLFSALHSFLSFSSADAIDIFEPVLLSLARQTLLLLSAIFSPADS
jgi:hypothetical protein